MFLGTDLTSDMEHECDVCIVGSGAGGSVLAAGLVARGLRVVMLEEGGYFTRDDFRLRESQAYPMLYQDRGTRATADLAITVLQGRAAGGGTVVNWTTCFRTPDRILAHWQEVHGIEGLDAATLGPHWDAVEERLGIQTWPEEQANPSNRALLEGCRALGWEATPLRRNVRGCYDSGYCGMGCPTGGKQDMVRTYLQDALDQGLILHVDTKVERLVEEGGRIVRVEAQTLDRANSRPLGPSVTVRPKVAVAAAGAIGSPALLLRSGLDRNGRVGKRTMIHPVVCVGGRYDHPIRSWQGAPQSVGSHQFIDRGADRVGYFLETPPVHPVLASLAFGEVGTGALDVMNNLERTAAFIALTVDGILPGDEGGTVSLREDGRIRLDYPVGPAMVEAMQDAHMSLARIHLAAGAREARTLHMEPVTLRSNTDLPTLAGARFGALQHAIFTAHQMGGCAMGKDPERSVVDVNHRHHHVANLFVVDGSVFPTALGVNPSLTVYGMAHRAVDLVGAAIS
jgi:choline dehydrogenase-like flavoprotein